MGSHSLSEWAIPTMPLVLQNHMQLRMMRQNKKMLAA
jgi:hypothetical protein